MKVPKIRNNIDSKNLFSTTGINSAMMNEWFPWPYPFQQKAFYLNILNNNQMGVLQH